MKSKITFSKQNEKSKSSLKKLKLSKENISQIEHPENIKGGAIATAGCPATRGQGNCW